MENSPKEFYDRFVQRLLVDFAKGNPRAEAAIHFASFHLMRRSCCRILDVGCGIGWSSFEVARHLTASKVYGVDLSPILIETAQRLFGDNSRIEFSADDVTTPSWQKGFRGLFDGCIMLDVYEHIPIGDRPSFHRALSESLGDSAILVLSCPTPRYQQHLRNNNPGGLQPVDEDVTLADLIRLGDDIGGEVTHFQHVSIWRQNDYFQAVVEKNLSDGPVRRVEAIKLSSKRERLRVLAKIQYQ
ncbi:MAG: methyltransferase domain-containing protein [Opitutales bacterium]|nr:methyltransferase domain-containing protein [Opitutales bacterium]